MESVLDKIVAAKRGEIAAAKIARPESVLREQLAAAPPVRNFFAPLAAGGPIRLIARSQESQPIGRRDPRGFSSG
jgi:indole-3-glycerol phosphate synthase